MLRFKLEDNTNCIHAHPEAETLAVTGDSHARGSEGRLKLGRAKSELRRLFSVAQQYLTLSIANGSHTMYNKNQRNVKSDRR